MGQRDRLEIPILETYIRVLSVTIPFQSTEIRVFLRQKVKFIWGFRGYWCMFGKE